MADAENQYEEGGMLTFADYFFDGIIFDWVVHGKISDCYNHTINAKGSVDGLVQKLEQQRNNLNGELASIRQRKAELLDSDY